MRVFISYARRDEAAVTALRADIQRSGSQAWFDQDLEGGQRWWDAILAQIQACDLFVVALSSEALASKACQAELQYATSLGRTVLPVMVGNVNLQVAPDPIATTQIVDYRRRTPESAMALTLAVTHAAEPAPLPAPLPAPPAAPMTSLGPSRERVSAPSLGYEDQVALVNELRRHTDNVDERAPAASLLRQLRARPDVVESIGRDIDALLARLNEASYWRDGADAGGVDASRGDSADLLRSLVTHIKTRHLTPILGVGMSDSLIGSRRDLTREWIRSFEFPVAGNDRADFAHVAQFVAVMSDQGTLREGVSQYLRDQIEARHPEVAAAHRDVRPDELLRLAWEEQRVRRPADPHLVVASLPCPVYITAHPATLLADALRVAGKDPQVEICRWRPGVYDWPASPLAAQPDYVPDVERPLVFHVFGNVEVPDSLVLTDDDYLAHLVSVTENKSLIPLPVRRAMADSALLLLGFELEEWDARMLLLSLIGQEGAFKLLRYTHVAAQVAPGQNVTSPARARRYLERYFSKLRQPAIDIYWGSVDEFALELAQIWDGDR